MRQRGIVSSWDLRNVTASDLEKATDDLISKTKDAYEKVESLSEDEINFENVVQVFKASLF